MILNFILINNEVENFKINTCEPKINYKTLLKIIKNTKKNFNKKYINFIHNGKNINKEHEIKLLFNNNICNIYLLIRDFDQLPLNKYIIKNITKNIAVIDDSRICRIIMKKQLKFINNTYNIFEFSSGNEFIDNINNQNLDFILIDFEMPGLNGIEIIKSFSIDNKNINYCLISDHELEFDNLAYIYDNNHKFIKKTKQIHKELVNII